MIYNFLFPTKPNTTKVSLFLLAVRIIFGILLMNHGIQKWSNFQELSTAFPDPIGLGSTLSLIMIICAEVGCSIFLIVGAFTRLATIPLIFSMLVVILIVHGNDPFQMKELPLLYLVIYIFLFFTGAGKISFDSIILKKINTNITK